MSRVVPPMIQAFARGGAPWAYLFDLIPHSGDAWAQKRYSTNAVNVDDEDYADALAKTVTRIVQTADIEGGGGIAAFAEVDVRLINQSKLHEDFLTDSPTGRKATIKLAAIGPNLCKNSTFGKYVTGTPYNFENWTEVLGTGGGGLISADISNKYDGSNSVLMNGGATTESSIQCGNCTIKRQQRTTFSWYMRGASAGGGEQIDVIIYIGGAYYDAAAGTFGATPVLNTFNPAPPQTWVRASVTFDWPSFAGTSVSLNARLTIQTKTGTINVDAVQIEGQALSDYYHNRYELAGSDVMTLYTASVRQAPGWDLNDVTLKLEPWQNNRHREVPITEVDDSVDSTWLIPKEIKGKPFPMTFGDFWYTEFIAWNYLEERNAQLARGICVNLDPDTIATTNGVEVYFDRPDFFLGQLSMGLYPSLWHFDKKAGRYYEEHTKNSEFIDDTHNKSRWYQYSGAYWLLQKRVPFKLFAKGEAITFQNVGLTNPANAIDGDLVTYMSNTTNNDLVIQVKAQQHELEHTIIIPDGLYIIGDFEIFSGSGTGLIDFVLNSINTTWGDPTRTQILPTTIPPAGNVFRNTPASRASVPAATHGETAIPVPLTSRTNYLRKILDEMSFEFALKNSTLGTTPETRIYECGLRIDFAVNLEKTNFAGKILGRAFQTSWDSRYNPLNYIRRPDTIIESIIRHELEASGADINLTNFDSAHTARASWYAAGQVHEKTESKDIIGKICAEFGLLYFIDEQGRHSLKALDWASSIKTLTLEDLYEPHKTLKFEMTEREHVVNSVKLYYRKNQFITDEEKAYSEYLYCNRNGRSTPIPASYQTKCLNSYNALGGIEQELIVYCDWCYDEVVAVKILQWLIDWLSLGRIKGSGELFFDNIDLEIGDIVALDSTFSDYLPTSITSVSRFVVTEDRIKRSAGRIGIKFLEVKQP